MGGSGSLCNVRLSVLGAKAASLGGVSRRLGRWPVAALGDNSKLLRDDDEVNSLIDGNRTRHGSVIMRIKEV